MNVLRLAPTAGRAALWGAVRMLAEAGRAGPQGSVLDLAGVFDESVGQGD